MRRKKGSASARAVVLLLGTVYLVLAVAGVVAVGWGEFGWENPNRVFGVVGVSTLANIVHGFVGVVAVIAAVRGGVFAFGPVAGVGFAVLSVFGIVSELFGGDGDPLNVTWWNVALYLLSFAVCGYVGITGSRAERRTG